MEGLYRSVVLRDQTDNVGRRDLTGDRGHFETYLAYICQAPE
jgi:hypothetical protein